MSSTIFYLPKELRESFSAGRPAPKPRPRWQKVLHPLSPAEIADEARALYGPWIASRINPGAHDRDRAGTPLPKELFVTAGELGLTAFTLPVRAGGQGRTWREWGFILHEISTLSADTALPMLLAYCSTVTKMLYETGRTDIFERYVRPMVRGSMLGGFAWSEGHDPFSFTTTLKKIEGGYILDGQKLPIANGQLADVAMVFARNEETNDIVVVLVERGDEGVEIEPYNAMGLRAAGMAKWRFNSVFLPEARLLVGADGLSWGQRFLNERRLEMPCWALGRMRTLFETCVHDMNTRIRYQRPLSEMQTIQAAIGRMYVAIETSTVLVRAALDRVQEEGADFLWEPHLAVLKSHVIEQALALARTIQDITGGYGVFESGPYERHIRDLQCLNPIAGTLATLQVDLGVLAADEVERIWKKKHATPADNR